MLIAAYRSWDTVTWQSVLTGLLIGTLVGMTGMGGEVADDVILSFCSASSRRWQLGLDILHGAIFKTVGAIRHGASAPCAPARADADRECAVFAARRGARDASHRQDGDGATSVMGYILGGALLFGATGLVLKSFVRKKVVGDDDRFDMVWRDRIAAVTIGVFGGFIVGLTSVGSGTFFALTMSSSFRWRAQDRRHGRSPAAASLYVAGFGHFIAGTSTSTPSAG